jgi:hypothetical protein
MNILTVVLSGLLALVGAYLGAILNRKTQHQNWLFQRRAEAYAKLWDSLESSQFECAQYLRSTQDTGMTKEQKMLDIFHPTFSQAKVVRLFASSGIKDQIEKKISAIYAGIATTTLGDTRFEEVRANENDLQILLENDLKNPNW